MSEFVSPFPESPRIAFAKNPIALAVLDARFDINLHLTRKSPFEFQKEVRDILPKYVECAAPINLPTIEGQGNVEEFRPVHQFSTDDGKIQVRLSEVNLSLLVRDYVSWEQFRGYWENFLGIFVGKYDPGRFQKTSLRYVDIFRRESLGLEGRPWSELIHPAFSSCYSSEIGSNIGFSVGQVAVRLGDHGYSSTIKFGSLPDTNGGELYQLDAEFICDQGIESGAILEVNDKLKRHAGRFFRWAIREELSNALEPTAIPDFAK